jgi:hypothetical protein
MGVLMTAQLPGARQEMIDGMRPLLGPIRRANVVQDEMSGE